MKPRRVPKLCHHKASGRAYVTDPASGRQVPLGRWGTSEADVAYGRWVAEFLARPAGVPAPKHAAGSTVDQLCLAFLAHAEGYYVKQGKPTAEVRSFKHVINVVSEHYGATPADAFGPGALKAVREKFVALGWSRGHVNDQIHRVRRIWRWGVEQEMVRPETLTALEAVAPLKKGRTTAPEGAPVKPVPWADVERTLPQLKPLWRVLVQVHYLGAMRAQDAVRLRPRDIDRTVNPWVYTPHSFKTEHHEGATREIHLGPKCQELLGPLLANARPDDWLFPSKGRAASRGRGPGHLTVDGYYGAVKRAAGRAQVKHWHPAQLRHTALTEIRKKYGLDGAQVAGGHAHASITELYAEADAALAARIARERG